MKTLSSKTILAILSLMAVVACGKKNSGDSAPPPAVVPSCNAGQILPNGQICVNGQITGIPGATGNLANNVQMQSSYIQGAVNFAATGTINSYPNYQSYPQQYPQYQPYPTNGTDPESMIVSYVGPVAVNGTIQVLNQSLCGAPIGSYMAQGNGMIQQGLISNLTLTLSGPVQMQIIVYKAVITNPSGVRTNSPGNRFGILQADLIVQGARCGTVATY